MTRMKRRPVVIGIVLLVGIGVGCAARLRVAQADFDQAVTAFEQKDYGSAIAQLEAILQREPDATRARILLGWSLYKKGNVQRAKREFEKALITNPNEPNAVYAYEGLGWIAFKAGKLDDALAAFTDSLRLNPVYPDAHNGLGWSYLGKGNLIRAAANFHAALGLAPGDLDARRGLAFVAYHHREWAQAIQRFREVVRRDPNDSTSLSALGWALYHQGNYRQARRIFADLIPREPSWADPHLGLARVAEREGRQKDAKAHFRAAIQKSAAYVATPDTRKLLSKRADWIDLWRELGWALYHQRAFAQAETEFRALVAYHLNDADGLRGWGYTLFARKRYREAIPILRRALAAAPRLPPVHERVEIPRTPGLHAIVSDATSTLAWSYYYAENLAEALHLFRQVTRRHPDWVDPWSGLGWTYLKLGKRAEARRAFRKAVKAKPNHPDALIGLRTLAGGGR